MATVTNSGTAQNSILDFVIPSGQPGNTNPPDFLNAYSTPAQSGTSGSPLIFDRNGASNGSSVSHTTSSANLTVQTPGYYNVSFYGTFSPSTTASLPLSVLLYLQQNGTPVPGAAARHSLLSKNETANIAFSQIVPVTTAPSTLQIVQQGGTVLYSDIGVTIQKIGDIS